MPIKRCYNNGVAGWKYGDDGECYSGPGAKAKAERQGRAIQARKHMVSATFEHRVWQCIRYKPTMWALGTPVADQLDDIIACVVRCRDGSWSWSRLAPDNSPRNAGNEPNIALAIGAVNDNLERSGFGEEDEIQTT